MDNTNEQEFIKLVENLSNFKYNKVVCSNKEVDVSIGAVIQYIIPIYPNEEYWNKEDIDQFRDYIYETCMYPPFWSIDMNFDVRNIDFGVEINLELTPNLKNSSYENIIKHLKRVIDDISTYYYNTDNELKQLFGQYSQDYFDEFTRKLVKSANILVHMVKTGQFEYDTFETDTALRNIRDNAIKVDI